MNQDYNVEERKPLILPEYGRNVQNMVDFCTQIEDRSERQKCAESIIQTMHSFSLKNREKEDYWQVLWDHLYIMSGFRLEVDFPYPVTTRKEYHSQVDRNLSNDHQKHPKYRQYGRNIERMVAIAMSAPEGDERTELARLTALQMKRDYISWNKDTVQNARIFADLYEMSEGQLYLDEMTCRLPDASELMNPATPQTQNNNRKHQNFKKKR